MRFRCLRKEYTVIIIPGWSSVLDCCGVICKYVCFLSENYVGLKSEFFDLKNKISFWGKPKSNARGQIYKKIVDLNMREGGCRVFHGYGAVELTIHLWTPIR